MADNINPYIAGNPVTGTEMFFDREDVFDFIRRTLVGKHRDNVIVLYGQRRTGKTSVLYQMRSRLDTRYLCIFMDLHGFALQGLDGFLWELANHIIRVLRRDYQIDLPRPSREEFVADPRGFFENEFLNQIWSAIGDRHVLLMLDEVIRLQEQVEAGKLEPEIFDYMRHLMQHYERLDFLFSLGSGLEDMKKEYAFLFNVGLYKKLSFLDRNATSDLITQPVKDYYKVEFDAVERIYQITSGHPYYTQLVCHCLFNCWVEQHISRIGVRDVDEVLNEAVERGSAVLKHVWEESTPAEKAILAGMASTMSRFNDVVDAIDINRAWESINVVIPKGEMAKAIQNLIARKVIVGQDKYTFTVDLQRLWVQKYRRLEWVEEEIADAIREWSSDLTLSEHPAEPPLPPPPPRRFPTHLGNMGVATRTRPLGVSVLAVLVGIQGVDDVLSVLVGLGTSDVSGLAIVGFLAVATLALAIALWKLRPWAFGGTIALEVIYLLFAFNLPQSPELITFIERVLLEILIPLVVLICLFAVRNVRAAIRGK